MKSKMIAALFLVMACSNAPADEISKQAKLGELMHLQGLREMIEQQQTYCRDQAKAIGPKIMGEIKKQLPEADGAVLQEIEAAYQAFVDAAKPNWTVEDAVHAWAEYYGAEVTEAELDQILAFYKSPIGQKDILAARSATPRWSAFFAERNQEVLDAALGVYVERLKAVIQRARAAKSGA